MITINIYDFDQDNFIGTNDIEQAVKLLTQVAINIFAINIFPININVFFKLISIKISSQSILISISFHSSNIKIFLININIFPINININIFPQFQFRIIEIIEYQKGQ